MKIQYDRISVFIALFHREFKIVNTEYENVIRAAELAKRKRLQWNDPSIALAAKLGQKSCWKSYWRLDEKY